MEFDDLVLDLLKKGLIREAETLVEAAGISEDEQERQLRFFDRALSGQNVDTLRLDPKKGIVSFRADRVTVLDLPNLIETVLRRVNKIGNRKYTLGRVRRGSHTTIEIEIGG